MQISLNVISAMHTGYATLQLLYLAARLPLNHICGHSGLLQDMGHYPPVKEDAQEKDSNIQEATHYGRTVRNGLFSFSPIVNSQMVNDALER